MKGALSADTDVLVPADVVWATYGSRAIADLAPKLLPNIFAKTEVEGDGGVDSIVSVTFPSGFAGPKFLKEKIVKIDDINRVKETEVIEGGFLDLGFLSYKIRLEIIDKGDDSSTVRSTIEYEIKEGSAATPSIVNIDTLVTMAETVGKHLAEKSANEKN